MPGDEMLLLERANNSYPDFNVAATARFFERAIRHPDAYVLIGPGVVGIASIVRPFHNPGRPVGQLVLLFGEPTTPWEPMKVLRLLVEWARSKGARRFRMLSEEAGQDLSPFARRLGARQDKPSFTLDLEA